MAGRGGYAISSGKLDAHERIHGHIPKYLGRRGRDGAMKPETLAVLQALAKRETASGIVGIGEVIDATGFEPHVVVNEVERLLREAYITGELQRLITGGDPRPWFLVNPLISEKGNDALETFASEKAEPGPSADPRADRWDAFISHASEDKANFVEGLARELMSRDLKVWYDDNVLEVGDSVRKAIDRGLRGSDFGIVVISRDFMRKDWPNRELDGILALEQGKKRLLPIWHGVGRDEVEQYSPIVAGRFAVRSSIGLVAVSDALCRAMKRGRVSATGPQPVAEPEPGPIFMSLVGQLANSRVYAWVVVGTAQETDAKFSDDEIESLTSWLAAIEPGATAGIANSGFIRMAVDSPDGGGTLWTAEVHRGPVINLLTALEIQQVPEKNAAVIPFETLVGWWATIVDGIPSLAANLQIDRVRLGFGLYPYGPNSTPVVGLAFGEASAPIQRARHQIPPWHGQTSLFDPFNPPRGVLDEAVHSLLDTFSYGRVEEVQLWVANGVANGTLKGAYKGHATPPQDIQKPADAG